MYHVNASDSDGSAAEDESYRDHNSHHGQSTSTKPRQRGAGLDQQTIQAMQRQRRLETQKRMVRPQCVALLAVYFSSDQEFSCARMQQAAKQARLKREQDRERAERARKLELHRLRNFGIAVVDNTAMDDGGSSQKSAAGSNNSSPTHTIASSSRSRASPQSQRTHEGNHQAHRPSRVNAAYKIKSSPIQTADSTHGRSPTVHHISHQAANPRVHEQRDGDQESSVSTQSRPTDVAATPQGGIFTADHFRNSKVSVAKLKAYRSPTYASSRASAYDDGSSTDEGSSDSGGLGSIDEEDLRKWGSGPRRNAKPSGQPKRGASTTARNPRGQVKTASGYQSHHGRSQKLKHPPRSRSSDGRNNKHLAGGNTPSKGKRKQTGYRAPEPISLKPVEAYMSTQDASPSSSYSNSGRRGGGLRAPMRNATNQRAVPDGRHQPNNVGLRSEMPRQPVKYYDRGEKVALQTKTRAEQLMRIEKQQMRQQQQRYQQNSYTRRDGGGYSESTSKSRAPIPRQAHGRPMGNGSAVVRQQGSIRSSGAPTKFVFAARVKTTAL